MKKALMIAVAVAVFALGATADTWTDPSTGITWTYTVSGGESSVDGVNPPTGAITIPSTLGGYPVTRIGDSAFSGCSGLTSIEIPSSVTSIGGWAFSRCSGLTSIVIPSSVTSIGTYAFYNCSGLTSIEIPDSVTSIGDHAFAWCSGLTSVTIPDSVTSIGMYAFAWCSGLTSVTIPDSVTSIGMYAFSGCSEIRRVTIPVCITSISSTFPSAYDSITNIIMDARVTSIGDSAFSGCSGLTSIEIPSSVTSIGNSAFSRCSGLTSIVIPSSVTSIGEGPFSGCGSMGSIVVDEANANYKSGNGMLLSKDGTVLIQGVNGDVTVPDSVTNIGDSAFSGCSGLTSVRIPNSVTSIGNSAFSRCSGLTSIVIPSSVTSIGDSAFSGCSGLTSVTIPEGVMSISYGAFYNCSGLTSVTIPDSVTSIGSSAFYECSGLTSVTIPEGVTSIGSSAFYGCSGLTSIEIPGGVTSIGGWAFYGCSEIRRVTIPVCITSISSTFPSAYASITNIIMDASVTSIGSYAFSGCSGLTSVTLPDSVTSIGDCAFRGCSGLTSVPIPSCVTSIGDYAFSGCSGLTSVTMPEGVTSIGDGAFSGCSGLTSVTIPNSVTSIGDSAFSGCSGLTSIEIPSSVTRISSSAFNACSGFESIVVDEANANYKSGNGMLLSKDGTVLIQGVNGDVTIPSSVTSIGYDAFSGCSGLTSVTIPDSVTSIGNSAFSRCSGLTSIVIPSSVTSIGTYAFYNCSGLTSIEIPDSVTSIGDGAFRGCSGLTSVTIPKGVTSIGYDAFYGCSGLGAGLVVVNGFLIACNGKIEGDLVIGDGVTHIANFVFNSQSAIRSVTIPSSVKRIGKSAFAYCHGITNVCVESMEAFSGIAFGNATANPMFYSDELYVGGVRCEETCSVTFAFENGLCGEFGGPGFEYNFVASIDVPFGKPIASGGDHAGQYALPEVYVFEDGYIFDRWEATGGNLNCVAGDLTVKAVCRLRTLQEMFDLVVGSWTDVSAMVIVHHAVYDQTTHTFRFQGAFQGDSSDYWCLPILDRQNSGDGITDHSLRMDVVLYDENYNVLARASGNRMLSERDIWTTSIYCYNRENVKYVGLELSSSYYEGTIQVGGCYSVDEIASKPLQHVRCDLGGLYSAGGFTSHWNQYTHETTYGKSVSIDNVRAGYVVDVTGKWAGMSLGDIRQGSNGISWICEADTTHGFGVGYRPYSGSCYYSMRINIVVPPSRYRAVYDVGRYGLRTGGGELEQDVDCEASGPETEPCVEPLPGCQFLGWDAGVWNEDKSEIVYTAQYGDFSDFSIEYVDTKGVANWNNPDRYKLTSTITFRPLSDTLAWHFAGWEPAQIEQGTYGDLVVTARWEVAKHTISQRATYGEAPSEQTNDYGSVVTMTGPTNVVWNGSLTNFVCIGSSCHVPVTNVFDIVVSDDLTIPWDVWQTNYCFRTAQDRAGWKGDIADADGALFNCHEHGSGVTVSAVAEAGYRFYKWIGDVDGDPFENPKTFAMTQARYVEPAFVEEKVAKPTISIPNGTILRDTAVEVCLTCATPGSTLYYTLDGTVPSASNGTKYEGAFTIGGTALIRAVAVKPGSDASDEASSAVVRLAPGSELPKVSITPGTSVQAAKLIKVTFAYDGIDGIDTEMRYTTDGSEPTADSSLYAQWFKLPIDGTKFVRAAAFANGARIGEVTSVRYAPTIADVIMQTGGGCGVLSIGTETAHGWTIDESKASPAGKPSMRSGKIAHGETSSMTAAFEGDGVVEFCWRASCETGSEPEFDFYVDRAYCLLDGEEVAWLEGETEWTNVVVSVAGEGPHELTWTYEKDESDDMTYPGEDCAWVSDVKFSFAAYVLFDAGEFATGDAPEGIVSSAGYSVTMPGCGGLRYAKHALVGWRYGDKTYAEGELLTVDAHEMTLVPVWREKVLSTPAITVAPEYDGEATVVTIACAEDATIRYTLDGSEPTDESPVYEGPFAVVGSATIKAIAMADDWYDSEVAVAATVRSWTTLEDCLNAEGFALATGGDWNWIGDSAEGCVKSVELATGETSWFTASFEGAGVVEWLCKSPTNDWSRQIAVFGEDGLHELKWEGRELWLKSLKFTPAAWASFVSDGEVAGELPSAICSADGYEIVLPGNDGFSRSRHAFAGWSDGVVSYQPGDVYAVTDDVTFAAVWMAKTLAAPTIAVAAWYDTETTLVSISSEDDGVEILYTTDGSEPTVDSKMYQGAFEVSGTCTIRAVAKKSDYFDSDIVVANTVRAPWSVNECLGNTNLVFTAGADAPWVRDMEYPFFDVSMRSGAVADKKSSEIYATVEGAGELTFEWAASSEYDEETEEAYDGLMLYVDGVCVTGEIPLGGEVEKSAYTCRITGSGTHVIRWRYKKDKIFSMGEDCVWISNVKWMALSELPVVAGDPGATVMGDAESGYVVQPSAGKTTVEVTIPAGVDAKKVTVVVGTEVETVKPNGAKVKVVKGADDITDYLDIPAADAGGAVDLTQATVKEAIVKEALDPEAGAEIALSAESPSITTAETKPGLTYTFSEGTTLEGLTQKSSKLGDGSKWSPAITVKGGTSGFYSIGVEK